MPSLIYFIVWHFACHFDIVMPCFICYVMSITIHVAWLLMCCMLKLVHVPSLFIHASPRFPFLWYCSSHFLLYQQKIMLHQDLSAVPLFPSPHTVKRQIPKWEKSIKNNPGKNIAVRSYHHLQWPVVSLLYRILDY